MGLVRYPAIIAPVSGSRTVATTQCADHAQRICPTLTVWCNSDGSWTGNPQCQCYSGFQSITVDGREVCIGIHCISYSCY